MNRLWSILPIIFDVAILVVVVYIAADNGRGGPPRADPAPMSVRPH